jgi:hypothetical protein
LSAEVTRQLAASPTPQPRGWGLTLRVIPRPTHDSAPPVTPDAWYDLVWSIPAVCNHETWFSVLPNCSEGPIDRDDDGTPYVHVETFDVSRAGVFGAPPELPFDQRLAAVPEITEADVDAWEARQSGVSRLLGGRDKVRELLESNRVHDVTYDHTAARFDWSTHATALLEHYRSLTPPKIAPAERVRYAGARLLRARQEEAAARQSAAALVRNADKANRAAKTGRPGGQKSDWARWLTVSRPTIDGWLGESDTHDISCH